MTRKEFQDRNAAYSKAVSRWSRSCIIFAVVVLMIVLRNPLPSLQVGLTFVAAVATSLVVVFVSFGRLLNKSGLACQHCGQGLHKPKRAELVLRTGKCPFCQGQVFEDKGSD